MNTLQHYITLKKGSMTRINAAHDLLNRTLTTGWKITEKIIRPDNATGSFFSVGYKAEKDGTSCFLKAFDFARFFSINPRNIVDVMGEMLAAYKYERDLSTLCEQSHVTKVSFVKDAGEEIVDGYSISIVPYLIFDMADGDVRCRIDFSENLDFAWRLSSLHDIAVGLKQLHEIEVSHQDLKPSNILLFHDESKIGDLGRSVCRKLNSPHYNCAFSGDYTYAPPEIMYGYYEADWHKRVYAADCYLLGSMIVYYFTGISMSALLMKYVPSSLRCDSWRGTYEEIKPYILDAFSQAVNEFEQCILNGYFQSELRWIVERLCWPFPDERGHPKDVSSVARRQYNLERFITKFDVLHKKARYRVIN